MGALFRWTSGFASRIDAMVSQIENHDALVSAAVRDAREARARAVVQVKRVREDRPRLPRRCCPEHGGARRAAWLSMSPWRALLRSPAAPVLTAGAALPGPRGCRGR